MKNLSAEDRSKLEGVVKATKDVNERNRICVILASDAGYSAEEIADILKISRSSVYGYLSDYEREEKTRNEPHEGKPCKLSQEQETELKAYLANVTYKSAKHVCAYVEEKYGISYTVAGMTDWLIRNGFVYKKPMKIPVKLDPEKQEAFIKQYHELKENLEEEEKILFMDSTHPEYQSQSAYGWILKGEVKTLATTAKQERVHFLGAVELNETEIITQEYETVNAESVIDFLKRLEQKVDAKTIHVICDNGKANRNKAVQEYLRNSQKIQIHYLPPYSPNLNPIERVWKLMKEEVTYNKVYKQFKDFSAAIRNFFSREIYHLRGVLRRRINDNFQNIPINPVQTSI